MHPCENDLVCRGTNEKIPYFNAPLYLENKAQIGKVDDIFGAINEYVSLDAKHLNTHSLDSTLILNSCFQ